MKRITKKEIRNAINDIFPQFSCYLLKNGNVDVFYMPNTKPNTLIGGLTVQLTRNNIWFRRHPPCSGGCLDSIDELIIV